ncbi:hypothetical protein [Luteimonas fraxinea]|uniref:hypothetical protein n=1 Tax=Luteimonas fraxinea TaxID=2901869 RepID=UPI001E5A4FF9|nr:hypothetical protein [Luteimonas fraxinea]MCD9125867.1 hypothetical protein [Luteimonas fraxinea]
MLIDASMLGHFVGLALLAGLLGGFFYAACRDAYAALCRLTDQRRREREFFADLADVPTGDRWHG